MKVITITNFKGGIAKTTTTSVLGACLKRKGYAVLCIEFDPQGNLSRNLRKDEVKGLREAMEYCIENHSKVKKHRFVREVIVSQEPYDIIPAGVDLAYLDKRLINTKNGQMVLNYLIKIGKLDEIYDFVLIDTSPTFGYFLMNAFTASDFVLAPVHENAESVDGLISLNEKVEMARKFYNNRVRICGILRSMWTPKHNLAKMLDEDFKDVAKEMGTIVFDTFIRETISVPEASYLNENLLDYNIKCTAARDYLAFTDEFLKKVIGYEQ